MQPLTQWLNKVIAEIEGRPFSVATQGGFIASGMCYSFDANVLHLS